MPATVLLLRRLEHMPEISLHKYGVVMQHERQLFLSVWRNPSIQIRQELKIALTILFMVGVIYQLKLRLSHLGSPGAGHRLSKSVRMHGSSLWASSGLLFATLGWPSLAVSEFVHKTEDRVRIYTTRDERRETGVRHELMGGLTVAALYEFEALFDRIAFFDQRSVLDKQQYSNGIELVAEFEYGEWLAGEIVFEYDSETGDQAIDEGVLQFSYGDLELEVGKLYTPLGEYFSYFAVGPALEFGETHAEGAVLSYTPDQRIDLALYAYRGFSNRAGSGRNEWGWGMAAELSLWACCTVGASYQSDQVMLADTVDAASAYVVGGIGPFEVSAEAVIALDTFEERADRPQAWNVEVAFFPAQFIQIALRTEGSRELEDEPYRRYGVSVGWLISETIFATAEYLYGHYQRGLAEDDMERELQASHQAGVRISVGF